LASLSRRLCKYEEDDVYTKSSILDTRFKLLWSKPEDVDDLTTDLKKTFSFIYFVANFANIGNCFSFSFQYKRGLASDVSHSSPM
jgi:hypothetical protein